MLAYRAAAAVRPASEKALLELWQRLFFVRVRNADVTSEMLRREMRQEVANAPRGPLDADNGPPNPEAFFNTLKQWRNERGGGGGGRILRSQTGGSRRE